MKRTGQLQRLRETLAARGPLSSKELCRLLQISQPTFSKLLKNNQDILLIDKGKNRKYAIPKNREAFPLVSIGETGEAKALGQLQVLQPRGAVFLPDPNSSLSTLLFGDIPYFIWDMRPQGYLGKIFVQLNSDLKLPDRWEDWSEEDLYRTLMSRGSDLSGNLILGNEAFELFQSKIHDPIKNSKRKSEYPKLAKLSLEGIHAGSSAGGEQAKFSAVLEEDTSLRHVIVKFSPPTTEKSGRRWADLLFAEELALRALKEAGYKAAQAEALESQGQVFLEVTRFDRLGKKGRKGTLSLGAIDDEHVGKRSSWTETSLALKQLNLLSKTDSDVLIFLDCFGAHIANTDRHFGNISVFWELGRHQITLAPAYDMLPMLYAPSGGMLVERKFQPPISKIQQVHVLSKAKALAMEFWNQVAKDERISRAFQKIASQNLSILKSD